MSTAKTKPQEWLTQDTKISVDAVALFPKRHQRINKPKKKGETWLILYDRCEDYCGSRWFVARELVDAKDLKKIKGMLS